MDTVKWTDEFLKSLRTIFGDRVWFVGLQGSYARGEATEQSDIDMVVILDEVTVADVRAYHAMLDTLPNRDRMCGFFSGKKELFRWETSDLFQFYYDTTPIYGSLDELLVLLDDTAVNRSIKIGACNIYHGCVHNMLFDRSDEILKGLYKAASFVVQAIVFRETHSYIRLQKDLLQAVSEQEREITKTFLNLKHGGEIHFEEMSALLMNWAQHWIQNS